MQTRHSIPHISLGNPHVTTLLLRTMQVEIAVLLVAGLVLFIPAARSLWFWELTPFNAVFLGAIYIASLVPVAMLCARPRWIPARLILPMQLVFAGTILAVSIVYSGQFDWQKIRTWAWFLVYIAIPLCSLYHLWCYRKLPTPSRRVLSPWQNLLIAEAILFGLYGLGLLIAPTLFASFWWWKIDAFHGRLYSAVFFTPAVGALLLAQGTMAIELFTLGAMQTALGGLALAGVVITDLALRRINWLTFGGWLWMALFMFMALAGLALMQQARLHRER